MTASRADYFREYARRNPERRRAIKAAYRERNKDKAAADKCTARAAAKVAPRKVSAVRAVKPRINKTEPDRVKSEAFLTLREKFAAFRAAKAEGLA